MPQVVAELDDDSLSFHYTGAWSPLKASSSDFQSTLHSTTLQGASVAIRFIATRAIIYVAIPAATGTSVLRATVTLDGHQTEISRPTNSTAVFQSVLFDSGTISNTSHTLVLTNAGSTTDSPLQFDRLHLQGSPILDIGPVTVTTSAGSPTSTITSPTASSKDGGSEILGQSSLVAISTSPGPASISSTSFSPAITNSNGELELQTTVTSDNGAQITDSPTSTLYSSHLVTTTEANGTVVTEIVDSPRTQSTPSSTQVSNGVVVGCVIGVLGLIALAIILLLLRIRIRRRRKGHMRLPDETTPELNVNVTPFDIRERSTVSGTSSAGRTTYHEAAGEFLRNKNSKTLHAPNSSSSRPAVVGETPLSVLNIPNARLEGQDGTYIFIPHHRNAPSVYSSSIFTPEEASPIYSGTTHSSPISHPGWSNDLPPSYQFNP